MDGERVDESTAGERAVLQVLQQLATADARFLMGCSVPELSPTPLVFLSSFETCRGVLLAQERITVGQGNDPRRSRLARADLCAPASPPCVQWYGVRFRQVEVSSGTF